MVTPIVGAAARAQFAILLKIHFAHLLLSFHLAVAVVTAAGVVEQLVVERVRSVGEATTGHGRKITQPDSRKYQRSRSAWRICWV